MSYQPQKLQWWYEVIADHMIANPDWTYSTIGDQLGRGPTYIAMIARSDIFQEYWTERRRKFTEAHDASIRTKMTAVAEKSLDGILDTLTKKRDQVPLMVLKEINESVMDRLGYSIPKNNLPGVHVNVNTGNQAVVVPATAAELDEARKMARAIETQRAALPSPGAGPKLLERKEELCAPLPNPA